MCFLAAPPTWLCRDLSDLIMSVGNCVLAIDIKRLPPMQISDLVCTLEAASCPPLGWILYNGPFEWVKRKSVKKQTKQIDRRARAVYG